MTKTDAEELKRRLWDATLKKENDHLNVWDSCLWVRFKLVTAVIDEMVDECVCEREENDER